MTEENFIYVWPHAGENSTENQIRHAVRSAIIIKRLVSDSSCDYFCHSVHASQARSSCETVLLSHCPAKCKTTEVSITKGKAQLKKAPGRDIAIMANFKKGNAHKNVALPHSKPNTVCGNGALADTTQTHVQGTKALNHGKIALPHEKLPRGKCKEAPAFTTRMLGSV